MREKQVLNEERMDTMKRTYTYFEVKSLDDTYGLIECFETSEAAIAEVNAQYRRAKERGYDNSHKNWLIVRVEHVKEFNDKGEFLKEETLRFVWEFVQYDIYDDAYVVAV